MSSITPVILISLVCFVMLTGLAFTLMNEKDATVTQIKPTTVNKGWSNAFAYGDFIFKMLTFQIEGIDPTFVGFIDGVIAFIVLICIIMVIRGI